jgi:peptidoglycan DL-endopeptidase CwlO
MAQAGVAMPRVASDQAMTGRMVPLNQLQPGDLLFYREDPGGPAVISHVAMYIGNSQMLQAPAPGLDVEIVPADFGIEFARAVRIYPKLAARLSQGY